MGQKLFLLHFKDNFTNGYRFGPTRAITKKVIPEKPQVNFWPYFDRKIRFSENWVQNRLGPNWIHYPRPKAYITSTPVSLKYKRYIVSGLVFSRAFAYFDLYFFEQFFFAEFFFSKIFPLFGGTFFQNIFFEISEIFWVRFFFIFNFEFFILEIRLPFRSFFLIKLSFFSNFIGNQSLKSIQTVLAFFFDFQFSYIGLSAIFSGMGCWKPLYPYKYAPKYPNKLFFYQKWKFFYEKLDYKSYSTRKKKNLILLRVDSYKGCFLKSRQCTLFAEASWRDTNILLSTRRRVMYVIGQILTMFGDHISGHFWYQI